MKTYTFPINGESFPGYFCENISDLDRFREWVARQRDTVAFDTESQGLRIFSSGEAYLRLAQFGTATEAWLIPVEYGREFRAAAADALRVLPSIVGHNLIGFDALVSDVHLGVSLEEICAKSVDTQILAKLLDPRQPQDGGIGAGLKSLSDRFIDPGASDTQGDLTAVFRSLGLTKETGWAAIPLTHPTYLSYAAGDVLLTSRLLPILRAELDRVGVRPMLVDYEHQIARLCATMARKGMILDADYTRDLASQLTNEQEKYVRQAARYGVSNINSTSQVGEALLGMGESLPEKTASGNVRVDKAVLQRLADVDGKWKDLGTRTPNPLAVAVLHAKRAGKWRMTYADTFLEEVDDQGRIHPGINPLQARTGRMSITKPAVQTLPSGDWKIRRCLLADPGHVMVSTDFQAVEMRVLAALADVKRMKGAISAKEDLHGFTARLVYGENYTDYHRKVCKGIGFGKIYGGGAATIQRQTGAPMSEVKSALAAYDRVYPEIKRMSARWQREARETGMVHVSVTGRRLPLDRDRTYAVVNYACQSAARDVLGQAMLHMEEAGLLDYMRLPIHDEVLASVPAGEAEDIAREFERCMTFDLFGVPIQAEAEVGGRSWGSLYGADF